MKFFDRDNPKINAESETALLLQGNIEPENLPVFDEEDFADLTEYDFAFRYSSVLGKFFPDMEIALEEKVREAFDQIDETEFVPLTKKGEGLFTLDLWRGGIGYASETDYAFLPEFVSILCGDDFIPAFFGCLDADKAIAVARACEKKGIKAYIVNQTGDDFSELIANRISGENAVIVFSDERVMLDQLERLRGALADDDRFKSAQVQPIMLENDEFFATISRTAYVFSAYADLAVAGEITLGDEINVVYYEDEITQKALEIAVKMGLPIKERVVVAQDSNQDQTIDYFISDYFDENDEVFGVKTAAAMKAYEEQEFEDCPTIVISTDSPFTSADRILRAIDEDEGDDAHESVANLAETTALTVPDDLERYLTSEENSLYAADDLAEKICEHLLRR